MAADKRRFHRDWLRELLLRHADNHPNMPGDLRSTALVVAPMVDASELPYRLLTRRYNANLCFTPMIHAKMFTEKPKYRDKFWKVVDGMPPEDRPLIAQFCGHDKHILLAAMQIVEHHVDGVDVNCGCPQGIAKRGRYGAFLMEEEGGDVVVDIVHHLSSNLSVPVSVKVRLLPSGIEDSLIFYQRLVDAGASMLTIHGRTRHENKTKVREANWDAIRKVVNLLGHQVPILANGGISSMDDVLRCLEFTGADGVMSSEAILEYPPLFTETNIEATNYKRTGPGRMQMASDYLELCKLYPPNEGGQGSGLKCIRAHLHRFLYTDLQQHTAIRDYLIHAFSMEAMDEVVNMVRRIHNKTEHDVSEEQLSWYTRHRSDGSGHDKNDGVQEENGDDDEEEKKDSTPQEEEESCMFGDMFGGEVCSADGDY